MTSERQRTANVVRPPRRVPLSAVASKLYILVAVPLAYTGLGDLPIVSRPPMVYLAVFLTAAAVFMAPRGSVRTLVVPVSAFVLLAWMLASWTWTANAPYTFLTIRLVLSTAVAMAIAASLLDLDDAVTWYVRSLQLAVFVSLLLVAVGSGRSSVTESGAVEAAWSAGFNHKNVLAGVMVSALPWFLSFAKGRKRALSIGAAAALIIGSQSVTGFLGATVAVGVWWWLHRFRGRTRSARSVLVAATIPVVSVCLFGLWSSFAAVTEFVGKDPTLSDRTSIWKGVLDLARDRILLGYGPGGVFEGPVTTETLKLWNALGHPASHAHNGLLQVQLDLGLVGVLLVVCLILACLADAVRLFDHDPTLSICVLSTIAAVVMMSFSESFLSGRGWLMSWVFIRIVTRRAVLKNRLPARLRSTLSTRRLRLP